MERIRYIDFLKFIGLIAIVTAHVGAPDKVMMLRSFDVPFMVVLSAILGEKAFQRIKEKGGNSLTWSWSRIKRLVVPTWIFLVIYFVFRFLVDGNLLDWKYYLESFGLTRYGIGYVWVILIYIYSALLIPIFSKMKQSKWGLFGVLLVYMLYEVLVYFGIGLDNKLFDSTFNYIVPYGLVTYLGYHYCKLKPRYKYLIVVLATVIFAGMGLFYWDAFGYLPLVQIAKYPPRLYFLGYGLAASFVLLMACEKLDLKIFDWAFFRFNAQNSLWIYLWHILVLDIYVLLGLPEVWYLKLPIVYSAALLIVLCVNKVQKMIESFRRTCGE